MFDFDSVVELMKKYGYSSTSVHPYVYQNGETWGLCYVYNDEEYGSLERIKIFENMGAFELFLQQLEWVKTNGQKYHVRMVLDNYEGINPKVIFLRNEKIMVDGEMFSIDEYDYKESQRKMLDDVSKIIYQAGDLLLVYDEIKGRQLQYLKNIISLKNKLRTKYFELQKEIDTYNKYKVERTLNLLPEVNDIGINDMMEVAIKDRYNMYIAQKPSIEEANDFLKEVWDLNKNLELNTKYYEALKEETDTRNELKVVEKKLDLMKKLNENLRPLFGIDLVSRFRKINKSCKLTSNTMSNAILEDSINRINRKYAVYDELDLLSTSDYLREAIQNTNYADLVIKYSKNNQYHQIESNHLPLNEVAASLSLQYRDKLTTSEQAIMVLYNNHKYRKLCDAILEIDGFDTLPVKKVISKINGMKGFSKIKSECYDIVKKRIDDPLNVTIKNSLFSNFNFDTFESFIVSLIGQLTLLKNVNNRQMTNGDIHMYLLVDKMEDIQKKKFVMVTNDLNSLLSETKETSSMVGITLLKENMPVLYSPYYFDVGDIYSKGASLQMFIKEVVHFELLIEISDITITVDPVKTDVVRYYSEPVVVDNISVVDDIKMNYKTTFCKFAFTSNLALGTESVGVQNMVANNQGGLVNPPVLENQVNSHVDSVSINQIAHNESTVLSENTSLANATRVSNTGQINSNNQIVTQQVSSMVNNPVSMEKDTSVVSNKEAVASTSLNKQARSLDGSKVSHQVNQVTNKMVGQNSSVVSSPPLNKSAVQQVNQVPVSSTVTQTKNVSNPTSVTKVNNGSVKEGIGNKGTVLAKTSVGQSQPVTKQTSQVQVKITKTSVGPPTKTIPNGSTVKQEVKVTAVKPVGNSPVVGQSSNPTKGIGNVSANQVSVKKENMIASNGKTVPVVSNVSKEVQKVPLGQVQHNSVKNVSLNNVNSTSPSTGVHSIKPVGQKISQSLQNKVPSSSSLQTNVNIGENKTIVTTGQKAPSSTTKVISTSNQQVNVQTKPVSATVRASTSGNVKIPVSGNQVITKGNLASTTLSKEPVVSSSVQSNESAFSKQKVNLVHATQTVEKNVVNNQVTVQDNKINEDNK